MEIAVSPPQTSPSNWEKVQNHTQTVKESVQKGFSKAIQYAKEHPYQVTAAAVGTLVAGTALSVAYSQGLSEAKPLEEITCSQIIVDTSSLPSASNLVATTLFVSSTWMALYQNPRMATACSFLSGAGLMIAANLDTVTGFITDLTQ